MVPFEQIEGVDLIKIGAGLPVAAYNSDITEEFKNLAITAAKKNGYGSVVFVDGRCESSGEIFNKIGFVMSCSPVVTKNPNLKITESGGLVRF